MATAPFPFFPTTVVPPPPCGCGAPAYAPCRFSTATTYPPPADAYTPTSGFSPNWPSWPPPSPGPAPSTTPPTFPSFPTPNTAYHHHHSFQLPPPSHPNPHWHQGMQQMQPPPPAPGNPWHPHHAAAQPPPPSSPPPRQPPPSSPPPLAASMAAVAPAWPFPSASVPAVQEGAAPSTSSSGRLPDSPGTTSAPGAALIVLCSGPGPERRLSSPSSAPVLAPSATQARRPKPPTIPSREVQARQEATISKNMPRAVLDLKRRLDEQQARDRNSFGSLQGELANLMSMAAQLAVSLGKELTSTHGSKLEQSQHISVVPAAHAHVAPQVFVEMPTPTSSQGTDGTAPNDCSGHHGPIQSTGVSNRSEQNLDYFLEQAAPETIFDVDDDKLDGRSNEFVPMFTATPEQQINGVEQQEDDQPLKCFCKPPETELNSACLYNLSDVQDFTFEVQPQDDKRACRDPVRKPSDSLAPRCSQPSIDQSMRDLKLQWDPGDTKFHILFRTAAGACLNVISDVQDFSLELQQQDDEKACICPVLKTSDSDVTNSSQLSSEHSMSELRQLWDPGASAVIVIPPKNDSSNYFFSHDKADLWSQSEHQCIVLRVVFEEVMLDKPPAKPPDRFRIALFPDISRGDIENIGIFVKLPWSIISAQHFQDFSRQMCSTFSTGCILLWIPWYAIVFLHQFLWEFSVKQGTQMPWDPGHATVAMTCEHATTGNRIICMEMHCGSTTVQVTEQRLVLEFSLMAAMLSKGSEFRDGQLLYMSQATSYTSPGCITKRTSTTSSAIT